MTIKILNDEIGKKDQEIKQLTNETMKSSSESNTKLALSLQETNFLKSENQNLKETV